MKESKDQNQQWMENEFIDLLNKGKIECTDLPVNFMKKIYNTGKINFEHFSSRQKSFLMSLELIPVNLGELEVEDQVYLLSRDETPCGLSDKLIEETAHWNDFTPNQLAKVLTYHPGLRKSNKIDRQLLKKAEKTSWLSLLCRNPQYIEFCSSKILSSFETPEWVSIVIQQPSLAKYFPISNLQDQYWRDVLLRNVPELLSQIKFTSAEPPAKLILKNIFAPDELSMKVEDFKRQLGGLLCHILNGLNKEDAENIAEESLHNDVSLGIYPMSRAYVFCTLIQQNYGIKAAVSLQRMPLVDFIPENDLECKILSLKNNEIMIACIEDGRLSRPDVFLTPEFQKLNIRTAMMLAFMGVPLQMRKNLVKWLQEHNADAETIEFFDGEYRLAATIQTREENEERLIKAVFEQDEFIVDVLSDKVSLSEISDDEVLAAWKLSRTVREKFFKKALYCRPQVMLLAKLLEQNNKINGVRMEYEELADEPADLINILIQALLI